MLEKIIFDVDAIGKLPVWVTTPKDFDPEKESLPVIVFLHGAGERGNDESVIEVGFAKVMAKDNDYQGLRVITISPCCPDNCNWLHIHFQTLSVIRDLVEKYNGDKNRITVTGLSMGGYGTWNFACMHSDYFAAAAPICGGGDVWMAENITIPVRAFHGEDDHVVPLSESVKMVERLKAVGGDVTLTVYPGVEHDSWVNAYEHSDLIKWLAAQHK